MSTPTKTAAKKTYSASDYETAIAAGNKLSTKAFAVYDDLIEKYKKDNADLKAQLDIRDNRLMQFRALISLAIASGKI